MASESAVSSVVGTVLMLGITVAVFGGFSVFALSYVQGEAHAPRADIAMVKEAGALYIQHKGGESFPARGGTLYVNVGGTQVTHHLSDPAFDGILSASWQVGDLLCVQGAAPGCLYAANADVRGAILVDQNALLAEVGERVGSGSSPTSSSSTSTGPPPPTQPFLDVDGDGVFTPGTDTTINATDLQDGSYDAGPYGLVIPASIGPISAAAINFNAGGTIVIAVDLEATTNPLSITSGGDIVFDSAALATLNNNNDMTLTAAGNITGTGLEIFVDGDLTINAGGAVNFAEATLSVAFSNRDLTITGASVNLTSATLSSADRILVTTTSGPLAASLVQAQSSGAQIWKSNQGGIVLDAATLDAGGSTLTACLATSTGQVSLAGTLSITDGNNKLNVQRASDCGTDARNSTYVTPWNATTQAATE